MITMPASCTTIFFICEFGEMVGHQFNLFDEELCQCNWYEFPIELQKVLMTFMSSIQRPAIFQGYGGTECTRDEFKKVLLANELSSNTALYVRDSQYSFFTSIFHQFQTIKCGFSYFMALRKMEG